MARKRLEFVSHTSLGLVLGGSAPRPSRIEKRGRRTRGSWWGKASVHPWAGPSAAEFEF